MSDFEDVKEYLIKSLPDIAKIDKECDIRLTEIFKNALLNHKRKNLFTIIRNNVIKMNRSLQSMLHSESLKEAWNKKSESTYRRHRVRMATVWLTLWNNSQKKKNKKDDISKWIYRKQDKLWAFYPDDSDDSSEDEKVEDSSEDDGKSCQKVEEDANIFSNSEIVRVNSQSLVMEDGETCEEISPDDFSQISPSSITNDSELTLTISEIAKMMADNKNDFLSKIEILVRENTNFKDIPDKGFSETQNLDDADIKSKYVYIYIYIYVFYFYWI